MILIARMYARMRICISEVIHHSINCLMVVRVIHSNQEIAIRQLIYKHFTQVEVRRKIDSHVTIDVLNKAFSVDRPTFEPIRFLLSCPKHSSLVVGILLVIGV